MPQSTEALLTEIEDEIKQFFPSLRMEFASQSFTNHIELWIYVFDLSEYERVLGVCRQLSQTKGLEEREPQIWLLAKTWTGPWPGGESEQELKRRRDQFRQKHGLALTSV